MVRELKVEDTKVRSFMSEMKKWAVTEEKRFGSLAALGRLGQDRCNIIHLQEKGPVRELWMPGATSTPGILRA